jgi:hypothetical protein
MRGDQSRNRRDQINKFFWCLSDGIMVGCVCGGGGGWGGGCHARKSETHLYHGYVQNQCQDDRKSAHQQLYIQTAALDQGAGTRRTLLVAIACRE